jgi:hypothetical protein
MSENATARFIEKKIAQGLIASDEARLLPDRFAGWWKYAADNDVANLSLGVAPDNMNDF